MITNSQEALDTLDSLRELDNWIGEIGYRIAMDVDDDTEALIGMLMNRQKRANELHQQLRDFITLDKAKPLC